VAEGIVVSIRPASRAKETMLGVAEAHPVPGPGPEGDRYFEGQGTLISTATTGAVGVEG
jgi:hypothetical protein